MELVTASSSKLNTLALPWGNEEKVVTDEI
jgi:hypothetical protein